MTTNSFLCRGSPLKRRGILSLSVALDNAPIGDADETIPVIVAVGRRSGDVDLIDVTTGETKSTLRVRAVESATAMPSAKDRDDDEEDGNAIHGLHAFYEGSHATGHLERLALLFITRDGCVNFSRPFSLETPDVLAWRCPPEVCCSDIDIPSQTLAVGCRGAELRLYSLETPQVPIFNAKGGRPNKVGLVDRPWNTAVAFSPPSQGKNIFVGTGHHKVRLYDTDVGRRPQMEFSFGESRITSLAVEEEGRRCWVSNAVGQIEVLDLRNPAVSSVLKGALKGPTGSVRQLALRGETGLDFIASVGLDRYLRIHRTDTRKRLCSLYLKTQLNCVAWCASPVDHGAVPHQDKEGAVLEKRGNGMEENRKRHSTSQLEAAHGRPVSIDRTVEKRSKKSHNGRF